MLSRAFLLTRSGGGCAASGGRRGSKNYDWFYRAIERNAAAEEEAAKYHVADVVAETGDVVVRARRRDGDIVNIAGLWQLALEVRRDGRGRLGRTNQTSLIELAPSMMRLAGVPRAAKPTNTMLLSLRHRLCLR